MLLIFYILSSFLLFAADHSLLETQWTVEKNWEKNGKFFVFEATSNKIQDQCRKNPYGFLSFPSIDQGAYEILLDNKIILTQGDPHFNFVHTYYGEPKISCSLVNESHAVTWRAYSYAKFFTFFRDIPRVIQSPFYKNVFAESVPLGAAAILIVFGFFTFILFFGKTSFQEVISLSFANILLGTYFLLTVSGLAGISLPMLLTHRLTESLLWIGTGLFLNGLRLNKLPGTQYLKYLFLIFGACVLTILLSDSGDIIQLGSVVGMFTFLAFSLIMLIGLSKRALQENFNRVAVLDTLSLGILILLSVNDILVATSLLQGVYLLPFGSMGALFFYTLSVNEKINITYTERDYLRANLEAEVKRKTDEIHNKNLILEKTILELKETQAELVQSAKLVSLGTLAAGIAHEINNALNYVNASIRPLEKIIENTSDHQSKEKALKLTKIMAEGLKLTFEIIASLRSYTGLNQAKLDDVRINDVVRSVIVLIKSKLTEKYTLELNIPTDITVLGSSVGLNQVFMNLITNALSAMPEGGVIKITARSTSQTTVVEVSDTGTGISENILNRIFEPFFTTKDVGSGTGLGLYIVKREIERQGGSIRVFSKIGFGTQFFITFPLSIMKQDRMAA